MIRGWAWQGAASAVVLASAIGCGGGSQAADAGGVGDGGEGGSGWQSLAPIASGAVQETAVVELGGAIYVLGGFHESRGIVDDVLVYDPGADSWDEAAPLPAPVHHANAAAVGGKIYVVGALSGSGFDAIGATWEYDPEADAWSEKTPMPAGTERGASAVGVVGDTIYLAGGFRNLGSVADVSSYDPMADAHDPGLSDLEGPLDHLVGAGVGDRFYVIGGRAGGITGITTRTDAYDPEADTWAPREPMPTARGGMAAGVVSGSIVVVGGEGNPDAGSGVFPQVELYDPAADAWTELGAMPSPRHGMGAAGLAGKLYVPGGADVQGFGAVDTNEALTVP